MCLDLTLVDAEGRVVGHVPGGLRLHTFRGDLARIPNLTSEEARRMAAELARELKEAICAIRTAKTG